MTRRQYLGTGRWGVSPFLMLPPLFGKTHRVWIMLRRHEDPSHLDRIHNGGRVGLDGAQVFERLPMLRLAGSRRIELAHHAKGAGTAGGHRVLD